MKHFDPLADLTGPWADLHIHTNASDGSLRPRQIVEEATAIGLGAIAITDHDTVDGVPEALEAGRSLGVLVIPGVEISVNIDDRRSFHLLGYGFELNSAPVLELLARMRESRRRRNELMLRKLQELGVRLLPEDVEVGSPGSQVGRPHMAVAMVKKGYVSSVEEAFSKYLAAGAPAYVPKKRPSYKEALYAIVASGGAPVMAHPNKWVYGGLEELREVVERLAKCGLMGIEVACPDMKPGLQEFLLDICKKLGLIPTGGTDFHGSVKPDIRLGFGKGTLRVPVEWAQGLLQATRCLKERGVGA